MEMRREAPRVEPHRRAGDLRDSGCVPERCIGPDQAVVGLYLVRIAGPQLLPVRQRTVGAVTNDLLVARTDDQSLAQRHLGAERICLREMLLRVSLLVDVPEQVADEVMPEREETVVLERRLEQGDRRRTVAPCERLASERVVLERRQRDRRDRGQGAGCGGGFARRDAGAQRGRETDDGGNERIPPRRTRRQRDHRCSGRRVHERHAQVDSAPDGHDGADHGERDPASSRDLDGHPFGQRRLGGKRHEAERLAHRQLAEEADLGCRGELGAQDLLHRDSQSGVGTLDATEHDCSRGDAGLGAVRPYRGGAHARQQQEADRAATPQRRGSAGSPAARWLGRRWRGCLFPFGRGRELARRDRPRRQGTDGRGVQIRVGHVVGAGGDRRRVATDAFGERREGGIGRDTELLAQQGGVDGRMAQRAGAVLRPDQRLHQLERDVSVQCVGRRAPTQQLDGARMITARRGRVGQPLERGAMRPCEPLSLLLRPSLELRRVGNEEPVEKRTAIQRDTALGVAFVQRPLEIADVARHGVVEPQVVEAGEYRVVPEILSQGVERLGQCVARGLGAAFRPEQREHRVATYSMVARRGEHREQREALPLRAPSRQRGAVPIERHGAQRSQSQHVAPLDERRRAR